MGREALLLDETEIRRLLDAASCIRAVEEAFTACATGRARTPGVIHLDVPESRGEIHVKAGHLSGGAHYAVKIASAFPGNPALGLPANDGIVLAFDARTGAPAAILVDNGFITDLRTGAAGAIAARHLSRPESRIVAVIGCGVQARVQIECLALVRPFAEVRVYGRRAERARACAEEMAARPDRPPGSRFVAVATARAAVEGADIVVTVTSSRAPIVRADWLAPGTHVTAVGSDAPDKNELEPGVLARAEPLVADSLPQCRRLGEIHHALAAGAIGEERVAAELGEITAGLKPGRLSADAVTVCDLTGLGAQDVAAAALVIERARAAGAGRRIAL